MDSINSIYNYMRFLKRLNYSTHTIKNYFNVLKNFTMWLEQPVERVQSERILEYIDFLLNKGRAASKNNQLLFEYYSCFLWISLLRGKEKDY